MTGGSGVGALRRPVIRLGTVIGLALLGLAVSWGLQRGAGVDAQRLANSVFYGKGITALLAVGLYASVYGISVSELRRSAKAVLAAITLGVAAKAFLAGGVMVLVYGTAGYLLLGVAVAQIDPLSVASTLSDSRMSAQAKSVLSAWASFDDPVTVLLVAYLAGATLPGVRQRGGGVLADVAGGSLPRQIGLNAALVAVAWLAWRVLRAGERPRRGIASCLVLAGLIAAAASLGLLAGIALCGLFFRPRIDAVMSRVADLAFYAATFLLGLLLVAGVDVGAGVLLGVAVFAAQLLTAVFLSRGMPAYDRVHLALGQQNGLTAIILALALAPYLPSAVGIIAVAILVVNIVHIAANAAAELTLPRISTGYAAQLTARAGTCALPASGSALRPRPERTRKPAA